MCRFLLVKSKKLINPQSFLSAFSTMCENSRAPDGDRQADGWGIAVKNQDWELYKTLHPIWEDKKKFENFPNTNIFVIHARSAGFPNQKGFLDYNQPYIKDDIIFTFNGMIKGVRIPIQLQGQIGAQKIFSLLSKKIQENNPVNALKYVEKLFLKNSREVIGMNIGLVMQNTFYILCEYTKNQSYFTLRYYEDQDITIVCSEPILSYNWKSMKKGEILIL